jgi:hypothetical protein
MLQTIISHEKCQLISLNLKGNVLCDKGGLAISEALKVRKPVLFV